MTTLIHRSASPLQASTLILLRELYLALGPLYDAGHDVTELCREAEARLVAYSRNPGFTTDELDFLGAKLLDIELTATGLLV